MKNVRLLFTGLLAASALAFSPLSQAQMTGQWYAGVGDGMVPALLRTMAWRAEVPLMRTLTDLGSTGGRLSTGVFFAKGKRTR